MKNWDFQATYETGYTYEVHGVVHHNGAASDARGTGLTSVLLEQRGHQKFFWDVRVSYSYVKM